MITQTIDRYPHDWHSRSRNTKLSRKRGEKVQCSCCTRFWPWDEVEVHHSSYEDEADRAGVNIFPVCGSKQDIGTCHHWVHQKGNWIKEEDPWNNRNTGMIVRRLQDGYANGSIRVDTPWLSVAGAIGAIAIGWFMMSSFLGGVQPTANSAIVQSAVNVRQGPGSKYPKSGKPLVKGAIATILEEKDGWIRIGDGLWVAKNYTRNKPANQ